jgi:hypothetical protein
MRLGLTCLVHTISSHRHSPTLVVIRAGTWPGAHSSSCWCLQWLQEERAARRHCVAREWLSVLARPHPRTLCVAAPWAPCPAHALAPKLWDHTRQRPQTQQRIAAARLLGRFRRSLCRALYELITPSASTGFTGRIRLARRADTIAQHFHFGPRELASKSRSRSKSALS